MLVASPSRTESSTYSGEHCCMSPAFGSIYDTFVPRTRYADSSAWVQGTFTSNLPLRVMYIPSLTECFCAQCLQAP